MCLLCADIRPDNVWRCIHGRELVLSLTILPPTIHNVARRKLRMIAAAKKVKEKGGNVNGMFYGCTSASNYNSLPDYMKK